MQKHAIILSEPVYMPDIPHLEAAYRGRAFPERNTAQANITLVKSNNFQKNIINILGSHGIAKAENNCIVTVDTVVTADNTFFSKIDSETTMSFFSDALEFCKNHIGEVYHACIHLDEARPHLHVQSVPIAKNYDGSSFLPIKTQLGMCLNSRNIESLFQTDVAEKYGLFVSKRLL